MTAKLLCRLSYQSYTNDLLVDLTSARKDLKNAITKGERVELLKKFNRFDGLIQDEQTRAEEKPIIERANREFQYIEIRESMNERFWD